MKILLKAPVVTFLSCNKQSLPVKQNKAGFLQHLLHLLALQMHCTGFWEEKRNQQISLDCLLKNEINMHACDPFCTIITLFTQYDMRSAYNKQAFKLIHIKK